MNYLQLLQKIAEIKDGKTITSWTSASANKYQSYRTVLKTVLADVFLKCEILRDRKSTFTITSATNEYSVVDGNIKENGVFIYGDIYPIPYCSDMTDFISNTTTGKPDKYTIYNEKMYFYPIPDDTYAVTVLYETLKAAITSANVEQDTLLDTSSGTDLPNFNSKFHDVLVYGTIAELCYDEPDAYAVYQKKYIDMIKKIRYESRRSQDNYIFFGRNPRVSNNLALLDKFKNDRR